MSRIAIQILVGAAFIALILVVKTKYERFKIPQNGMAPNYPASSTHWVTKGNYTVENLSVGDVVVFEKIQDAKNYNYVCRIVGMPGDRLEINGRELIRNGVPATRKPESSANGLTIERESLGESVHRVQFESAKEDKYAFVMEVVVQEDHVFVMGDNRFGSLDSRHYGAVPIDSVLGKM